jgi:dipeptidyl aminopeptidase/acylaminoacyl peptidase
MKSTTFACACALAYVSGIAVAHAEPPPISAFVGLNSVTDVTISPQGRYLSMVVFAKGRHVAVVRDLTDPTPAGTRVVMQSDPDKLDLEACRWVTETRLMCDLREMVRLPNGIVFAAATLAGVDADGKNPRTLMQQSLDQAAPAQIVDMTPGKPGTILVAAQRDERDPVTRALMRSGGGAEGRIFSEFPGIFSLDTVSGQLQLQMGPHAPMFRYISDHHGNVRLGWGVQFGATQVEYYVRPSTGNGWQLLFKEEYFTPDGGAKEPVGICPDDLDCAYATGPSEGRDALWRIDLTGKKPPTLEFSHPVSDVTGVFSRERRLLGVVYETDRPFFYPTAPRMDAMMSALKSALPDAFVMPVSSTRDAKVWVVRTTSDVDAGTYYLYNTEKASLARIGGRYPDLDPKTLGRMQSISYPAQDGTSIPGYLTVPPGRRAEHLPLIVMPHGGPIYRDGWVFDFVRAFLVSRGYAVLQMNFRGSSGYGYKWRYDAHQDWGGLTYSDVTDGARWAIKQGIADPKRMCIVGWSFGGYVALLGAVRNPDLYRCSISIAGISDLSLLEQQAGSAIARQQIGTNSDKLRQDSARRHAAELSIPLLMIHGDRDAQAQVEQSDAMDSALREAGKRPEFVRISGATHQMSRESDIVTLLTAVEKFLSQHIGPAPASGS